MATMLSQVSGQIYWWLTRDVIEELQEGMQVPQASLVLDRQFSIVQWSDVGTQSDRYELLKL